MKAHGQFENAIFRAFEEKKYALQFITGTVRFGYLYKYKEIEGKRQDISEGVSHIKALGSDYRAMFASTNIYVCCFHRTLEAARKADFGRYIVKVENPKLLAIFITDHMKLINGTFWGGVEGVMVEYDKGMHRTEKPSNEEILRLTYAQKPRDPFHIENEFRFVILCKENHGDSLEIKLANRINGCQLFENF